MCTNNSNCTCTDNTCGCKTSTSEVVYQGPALTCVGINNCDTITEVLQQLNSYICSEELVSIIINNIITNVDLYQQFTTIVNNTVDCETVWGCQTTTTTTTLGCTCTDPAFFNWDVVVTSIDISNAVNSTVYVEFFNCDGLFQTIQFENEGEFVNAFCGNVDLLVNQYYFNGSYSRVLVAEQPVKAGICCPTTTTTTTLANGTVIPDIGIDPNIYGILMDGTADGIDIPFVRNEYGYIQEANFWAPEGSEIVLSIDPITNDLPGLPTPFYHARLIITGNVPSSPYIIYDSGVIDNLPIGYSGPHIDYTFTMPVTIVPDKVSIAIQYFATYP